MSSDLKKTVGIKEEKSSRKQNLNMPPKRTKPPVVLSSQRYLKIVDHATKTDKSIAKQESEEEQRMKAVLKAGNDNLVSQFVGNMQITKEEKIQAMKEELEKKNKEALDSYQQSKENEAKKRRDKVAKAQEILEKLKPGPRELHTAALQSEVLRARNVQRCINDEYEKAVRNQESENQKICEGQSVGWIKDEQLRLLETQKNTDIYKKELLQTINENQKQKMEYRQQLLKEQLAQREAMDKETKDKIEKERSVMEKKREALRKSALEAMKMVEQRRLRDRMADEVENRLCCVYNTGKRQLDMLRQEQTDKMRQEHTSRIEQAVNKLSNNEELANNIATERTRRDISTMQLKFTAEEQEKIRKDKAAKQARIQAHLREMEQMKELERISSEVKLFDVAQRLKNAEVNALHIENERKEKERKILENRQALCKQMEENRRHKLAEREENLRSCTDADTLQTEHKYFFNYARNLMEDAQQKGKPLYPYAKAVQEYKKQHQIDCERKIPKHLDTKLQFGRRQPNDSANEELPKTLTANTVIKERTREDILRNCMKINEIIIKDVKKNNENEATGVADSLDKNAGACGDELKCQDSARVRYSMLELKKLNQFAGAASCH